MSLEVKANLQLKLVMQEYWKIDFGGLCIWWDKCKALPKENKRPWIPMTSLYCVLQINSYDWWLTSALDLNCALNGTQICPYISPTITIHSSEEMRLWFLWATFHLFFSDIKLDTREIWNWRENIQLECLSFILDSSALKLALISCAFPLSMLILFMYFYFFRDT